MDVFYITMTSMFILMAVLFLLIWKSDLLYDKSRGGWKPGINLPHLFAEKGDIIDHIAYKRYIGITGIVFS